MSATGPRCVAAAFAAALAALTPFHTSASANAVPAWHSVASPEAVRPQAVELNGVACATTTMCVAVGSRIGIGVFTHAEGWDGQRWNVMTTPALPSGWEPLLNGVACAAPDRCFAVGSMSDQQHSPDNVPLLEQWDGAQWTSVAVPVPNIHHNAELAGISCGGPTSCIAVGNYETPVATGRLVLHWDGRVWTFEDTPSPSPVHVSSFRAVSCPSPTDCTAVGDAVDATNHSGPMIEHRSASGWTIETPGASTVQPYFTGISCPDTWHCLAVADASVGGSLAQFRRGGQWTAVDPPGAIHLYAAGVACVSATDCVVTGRNSSDPDGVAAMARWQNGTWSRDSVEAPGSTATQLNAVACVAHACQAVGEAGAGMYRRGQGTSWLKVPSAQPVGPVRSNLSTVSCGDASHCLAVGDAADATGNAPFAISWDGARWTTVAGTTSLAAAGAGARAYALSCAARMNCMAVGEVTTSGVDRPFAAHWNGNTWSVTSFQSGEQLYGVWCTATTDCTAVGGTGHDSALIERWNGTAWHEEGTNVTAHLGWLDSISCPTTTTCAAVGVRSDVEEPGSARRVGSTWSLLQNPRPDDIGWLWSVSCGSPSSCLAVGLYDLTGAYYQGSIVQSWTGQKWNEIGLPAADKGGPDGLMAVSCPNPSSCWVLNQGPTYLMHWNGAHITPASAPAGLGLDAISCLPGRPCVMVGSSVAQYG